MNDIRDESGELLTVTSKIPLVHPEDTIGTIKDLLYTKANQFDSIDYIYITDSNKVLKGVISIKTVFYAEDKTRIEKLMDRDLITISPGTSQRKVVYLALSNGLKAIPLVDKNGHFLGVIPYDNILKIFNNEYRKEIFSSLGVSHRVGNEYTSIRSTAGVMIKSRLPWLIIGVFGGTLAASVISGFEEVISKVLALASFIPVLVYMSDAVGTQSEALIIRSIALEPGLLLRSYILREIRIAAALAVIVGAVISLVAAIGWSNYVLGLIIGFSMFFSIIVAVLISTLLPLGLKKLHSDPAVSTGPIATIISDITTITVYFSIAILFLDYFQVI